MVERRAAPALLALCVLASGCGGGSSSKNTSTSTSALRAKSTTTGAESTSPPLAKRVSRAQLDEIANGVCRQVKAGFKGGAAGNQFTEIAQVASEHAVIEERAAGDLAALIPPDTLAIRWASLVSERRTLAQELSTLAQAAHEQDSKAIVSLEQSKSRRQKTVVSLARSLGVEECASYG